MVRISIANLVTHLRVVETGRLTPIAILSPGKWKQGKLFLQALGGGSKLTQRGREYLTQAFGAREFEGDDARFLIEDAQLDQVMRFFEERDSHFYEIDALRECIGELTADDKYPAVGNMEAIPQILNLSETGLLKTEYYRTVRQPVPEIGSGTSGREIAGVPSRRLFHLFTLSCPEHIADKIQASDAIDILLPEEIASTNGGSRKGKNNNDIDIADNIGLANP